MPRVSWLRLVERVLNGRYLPGQDRPSYHNLVEQYHLVNSPPASSQDRSYTLSSEPIVARDERIRRLFSGLRQSLVSVESYLDGCWLHGSLATYDDTSYSDVDAFLIIKPIIWQDDQIFRAVQRAISDALPYVLEFDPHQHHGFFVGFSDCLTEWPAPYLPGAALQYARPLWTPTIPITMHERQDMPAARHTFNQFLQAIHHFMPPKTLYQAKAILSQFMLLPAIYCQALGKPVYKRDSFPAVQPEFALYWQPMMEATRLRAQWPIPARPLWSLLLKVTNPWLASRLYRPLERQLPACHSYPNWSAFIKDMQQLAAQMSVRFNKITATD